MNKKSNVIYYLIITYWSYDEPITQMEFWDIETAFQTAREYEKQKKWRKIEIYESTIRKHGEEIQPDKLYYIKTNY